MRNAVNYSCEEKLKHDNIDNLAQESALIWEQLFLWMQIAI